MIKCKRLHPNAILPKRMSEGAAGFDLFSRMLVDTSDDSHLLPTGIAIEIPQGYVGLVLPRSGLTLQGIDVVPGTIDSDYRGEVYVQLRRRRAFLSINVGDRIAQIVFLRLHEALSLVEVEELSNTKRGAQGFGSTGR